MNIMKIIYLSIVLSFIFFGCQQSEPPTKPKTLLFGPITPEYLQATAAEWKSTGFDGFLLSGIMRNWSDDIWATDGDSTTRGTDDLTFQRIKACNEACREAGIEDNFIKIAFYSHVPLWTDDDAWKSINQNFFVSARKHRAEDRARRAGRPTPKPKATRSPRPGYVYLAGCTMPAR